MDLVMRLLFFVMLVFVCTCEPIPRLGNFTKECDAARVTMYKNANYTNAELIHNQYVESCLTKLIQDVEDQKKTKASGDCEAPNSEYNKYETYKQACGKFNAHYCNTESKMQFITKAKMNATITYTFRTCIPKECTKTDIDQMTEDLREAECSRIYVGSYCEVKLKCGGMSGGAVAAIVIFLLLLFVVVGLIAGYVLWRRRRASLSYQPIAATGNAYGSNF